MEPWRGLVLGPERGPNDVRRPICSWPSARSSRRKARGAGMSSPVIGTGFCSGAISLNTHVPLSSPVCHAKRSGTQCRRDGPAGLFLAAGQVPGASSAFGCLVHPKRAFARPGRRRSWGSGPPG